MFEAVFRAFLMLVLCLGLWLAPWWALGVGLFWLVLEGLLGNRTRPHAVEGAVVLVTGASSGLGRALAVDAAWRGASRLMLVARRKEALEETQQSILQTHPGCEVEVFCCDLTDMAAVSELVQDLLATDRTPDIIVNNAGAGSWWHMEEGTPEDIQRFTACPYLGAAWLVQGLAPAMIARRSGHVLNITSAASLVGFRAAVVYGTARWSMRGFSLNLAADMAETGVGVTLLNAAEIEGTGYFSEENAGEASRQRIPWLFQLPWVTMFNATTAQTAEAAWNGVEAGTREVLFPRILLVPTKVFYDLFPSTLGWLLTIGENGRRY